MSTSTILEGICINSTKGGGLIFVILVFFLLLIGWALGHDWKIKDKKILATIKKNREIIGK